MNDQRALFAITGAVARHSDPDTSHEAAASIPRAVEDAILHAFQVWGPMHDDELARRLPARYPPTVKSARSRLTRKGWLVNTGARALSDRGCHQIVWTLAG